MYNDLMAIGFRSLFLLLLALGLSVSVSAQEEWPFWRQKPGLYKKILENRKVVVSVDMEASGRERRIRITGVGVVNVPLYFALEQVMNFEDLPKASSYFQKVVHRKEKKEVYFHIQALGTQVRFVERYKWGKRTSERAQMDWLVTWGAIKGMTGHYGFREVAPGKTEVVIWAHLKKFDIPLPEFLINFTLEVIAEKTAQKMRTFMEENYRQTQKVSSIHGYK